MFLTRQSQVISCLLMMAMASAFVTAPLKTKQALARSLESSTLLKDSERDEAAPLPLSTADLQRLMSMKSRHMTIPLLIMDAVVPGQTISFESADPKFLHLVNHVLEEDSEIGMIGLNPHTGQPLNVGVTLPVSPENVMFNPNTGAVTVHVQAKRRFEVQGEPWLHHNDDDEEEEDELPSSSLEAAFYMADVELIEDRQEEALADDVAVATQNLADQIPDLVGEWVHHLVATNRAEALRMESRMMELGPLPSSWRDQALWVAALLNPAQGAKTEEKVCLEIRPAMLSCHTNYERMVLATAALQSSIDHVSGKKRLF
ncbi:ATP-dependent protease La (LON) domain [Seminavis robusta]|uniref:ATP-dependent protease La (LON) domain n=1 Tax=Seminavis robusta TaxID=568900 RepID=A0A9N8EMV9_9STRA|nr:ATP-dependent protease La (LON) domain [Seminavis robusta]|eukprot:Sro1437_g272530.1 ATP-dependent protease La (LON) domain (316) ;mRNA; f:10843-11913